MSLERALANFRCATVTATHNVAKDSRSTTVSNKSHRSEV